MCLPHRDMHNLSVLADVCVMEHKCGLNRRLSLRVRPSPLGCFDGVGYTSTRRSGSDVLLPVSTLLHMGQQSDEGLTVPHYHSHCLRHPLDQVVSSCHHLRRRLRLCYLQHISFNQSQAVYGELGQRYGWRAVLSC